MLSGESCVRFLHDASSARSRNRMRQIVGKIVPSKSPFRKCKDEQQRQSFNMRYALFILHLV